MSFVNTIDLLGDEVVASKIVNKSFEGEFADNLLTSVGMMGLYKCENITKVKFPNVVDIGDSAISQCSALIEVDFSKISNIGNNALRSCKSLLSLIIRSNILCTLHSIFSFYDTPIYSGTGYIYVPRALVEDYKVATNWGNFANQFRALEDYTVDGTITGELDPNKI